jgi:hypothetical protein
MNRNGLGVLFGREAWFVLFGFVFGAALVAGCGGGKKEATLNGGASASDSNGEAEEPADEGTDQPAKVATTQKKKSSPQTKRPMIGDIPLDVWLDDPLAVASAKGNVAKAAPAATTQVAATLPTATTEKPATTDTPASAAASEGGEWANLISSEVLADEVKQIRLRMNQALTQVTLYNGRYKEIIAPDGAELAALAGIVTLTKPDGISWKDNAHLVREFAGQVSSSAKGLGQGPYDATKLAFENVDGLLNGTKPAKIPEGVAPTMPFNEVVTTKQIMKRLQRTEDALKAASNEALFKKEIESIVREASVLAALIKVISSEGCPSADEEEFQKFAKDTILAGQDMVAGAKSANYAAFEDGKNRMLKKCSECHLSYRTGN